MKGYFDARFLAALGPNTPNILNVPLFLAEGELYGEDGRLEIKDPTVSLTIPRSLANDVLKTPRSTIVWYRVVDGTLQLKITQTVTPDRDNSIGNSATIVITPLKKITKTDIMEKKKKRFNAGLNEFLGLCRDGGEVARKWKAGVRQGVRISCGQCLFTPGEYMLISGHSHVEKDVYSFWVECQALFTQAPDLLPTGQEISLSGHWESRTACFEFGPPLSRWYVNNIMFSIIINFCFFLVFFFFPLLFACRSWGCCVAVAVSLFARICCCLVELYLGARNLLFYMGCMELNTFYYVMCFMFS